MTPGTDVRDIAITGMDCQFPGSRDVSSFWAGLLAGADGIGPVPTDRWTHDGTATGGFLADPAVFDNEFYGIGPGEAAAMDPQQRLLLPCAWRALEDAGVDPARGERERTGVYIGVMSTEWAHLAMRDPDSITAHVGAGNGHCMAANRLSYHLDLHGPSMAVDTACSSSLVAVHQAARALLSGECDRALAGGVNLIVTRALHVFYERAGLAAPDGRCKPFSALGDGIGRGEGVGVVVLRRLADALADGDRVYAVIRGSAVNHDGRSNGLTAPNRWAQIDVLRQAYRSAAVDPAAADFIEAHGTGTVLGDLIEARALGEVQAGRAGGPCLIGSVKGNVGHLEGAAGVAGLIKAALAVHHRRLPRSRFAESESPQLKLGRSGLRLAATTTELSPGDDRPLLAGVSSFGLGGTNAHVVLGSAPVPVAGHAGPEPDGGVFTISGDTVEAVGRNAAVLADDLRGRAAEPVSRICAGSHRSKASLPVRAAIPVAAGRTTADLADRLDQLADNPAGAARRPGRAPRIGLLFGGQGSQHPGMTAALLASCPGYRDRLAEADAAIAPHLGASILAMIETGDPALVGPSAAQPALFAVQYAMGARLYDAGVRPVVVAGHSIGEYAALCLDGAWELADAAELVTVRARLMAGLPVPGAMLAVRGSEPELAPVLDDEPEVVVAAVNSPVDLVLSGPADAVDRVGARLAAAGSVTTRLPVTQAFHSPVMTPMTEPFRRAAQRLEAARGGFGRPGTGLGSTVTGTVNRDRLTSAYLVEQITAPVRFRAAVEAMAGAGISHLIEVGPRPMLTGPLRRIPAARDVRLLATAGRGGGPNWHPLLAELYVDGVDPAWDRLDPPGRAAPLSGYAFAETTRYWRAAPATGRTAPAKPVLPMQKREGSTETDLRSAVLQAVSNVTGYDTHRIRDESRLYEDLGFDSVMLVSLKTALEQRLPRVAPIDVTAMVPHVSTVNDLVRFLRPAVAAMSSMSEEKR